MMEGRETDRRPRGLGRLRKAVPEQAGRQAGGQAHLSSQNETDLRDVDGCIRPCTRPAPACDKAKRQANEEADAQEHSRAREKISIRCSPFFHFKESLLCAFNSNFNTNLFKFIIKK